MAAYAAIFGDIMFDSIKKFATDVIGEGEKALSRAVGKKTFKRVVCAGYLIASADGDFDADEKNDLSKIVQKTLPQFDLADILGVIDECDDKISFSKTMGTMEILDDIGGATGDDAKLIMRVCCFIGESNGKFEQCEKLVARDIAMKLKVSPSEYNL